MTLDHAPKIHVGDPSQPVRQVIVVHAEPAQAVAETSAWLSREEAARRLGVDATKVSRLAGAGELSPTRKVGRTLQVHVDAIAAYEAALPSGKRDEQPKQDAVRNTRQALRVVRP